MFLDAAYANARRRYEMLYEDTCTIYVPTETEDENGRTASAWAPVCENQPCRLSFSSLAANTAGDLDLVNQTAKLFISPDVEFIDGARISVRRSTGHVSEWQRSGLPAVYPTHQEIVMAPLEVYA